jgi:formate C-acetyltransferase
MVPDAPGRVDQYLFPWYERDVQNGTLTREFARELLTCLWLKYFESVGAASGVSAHNHLTLGGVKADGGDAANEVTTLCLEVTEELRILRPQVGLRWHRHTPPALLRRAVRTLRSRTGNPDFCSDEQIVPALASVGVRIEDARDFSLSGCHEVIVTGRAQMGSVEGFVNMPKVLRMTLGLEPGLQPDADVASLDSFDALWQGLERSMEQVAQMAHEASVYRDRKEAERPGGDLVVSLLTRDCIENARGYTQGGARYNFCNWDVIGIANLADSLAAIERWVYEQRALTLAAFAAILAADWQGHEPLRREIIRSSAHFGNDQQSVDATAARIITAFSGILKRRTPFRGGEYILGTTAGGENMHIEFGHMTGATPDGRKAGAPLADSLGAAQGRDRHGVTALLNSVARLPHQLLPTATTCNVKLDPKLLDTEAGLDSIAALIEAHFRSGGQQLQFSLVNREMLLDAKRHPEQYADLMVRVCGYSAPFTSLWADLQDEIIARTMHEVFS